MRPNPDFTAAMARCPLVAILRGVKPDEVEAIAEALIDEGFAMIEVPLNSPDPMTSIERLAKRFGTDALVGGGTVLSVDQVETIRSAGGRLIVSPNTNPEVIAAAVGAGLISLPGYFTPSEAFAAIAAGASGLKLFPAESASPAVLRAHRAVLPPDAAVLAVGGITPEGMAAWRESGAQGFGLGSALYRPGNAPAEVRNNARAFVAALG